MTYLEKNGRLMTNETLQSVFDMEIVNFLQWQCCGWY